MALQTRLLACLPHLLDTPEHKPITQSRDTQELPVDAAMMLLHIFHSHHGSYAFTLFVPLLVPDRLLFFFLSLTRLQERRHSLLIISYPLHRLSTHPYPSHSNDQHEPTSIRQHPPWCACRPADLVTAYSATLCQGCRRDGLHETSAVAPPSHAKEPHKTHRPWPSC